MSVAAAAPLLSTALVAALAAHLATPWVCRLSGRASRWTYYRVHVVAAAGGGALAAHLATTRGEWVAYTALAVGCALLSVIDLIDFRLPNVIVKPLYLAVGLPLLASAAAHGQWMRLLTAVAAAAASAAGYYLLAWISPSGLGLGDVKLAGVLGLALGWQGWLTVFYGALLGFVLLSLFAVALIVSRRIRRGHQLPFGPWMIAGAALASWALG